jgi:hypothetical protein
VSSKGQKDGTTFHVIKDEIVEKYFLSSHNLVDSTPIVLRDVASFNNVAWFDDISKASNNQQPIEIDVQVINLIDSPSTKSNPLGFFNKNQLILMPFSCILLLMCQFQKQKKVVL